MKKTFKITLLSLISLAFLCGASGAVKQDKGKGGKGCGDCASILPSIDAKKEAIKAISDRIKECLEADKIARQKQREEKLKELEKKDPEKAKLLREKFAGQDASRKLEGKKGGKGGKPDPARQLGMKSRNPALFALFEERKALQEGIKDLRGDFKECVKNYGQKEKTEKGKGKNKEEKKDKKERKEKKERHEKKQGKG